MCVARDRRVDLTGWRRLGQPICTDRAEVSRRRQPHVVELCGPSPYSCRRGHIWRPLCWRSVIENAVRCGRTIALAVLVDALAIDLIRWLQHAPVGCRRATGTLVAGGGPPLTRLLL